MKRLRIPKWLKVVSAVLALTGAVGFLGAYAWLRAAPRDVGWLLPSVHAALEEALPGWQVSFGAANAEWGGFGHPLTLHFRDAVAVSPEKRTTLSIPDLHVGLHPLRLLIGRVEPATVRLSNPSVKLRREAGLGIALPWAESHPAQEGDISWKKQAENLRDKWLEHIQQWQLQRVILENAKLFTSDDSGGQEVELAHANLRLQRQKEHVRLRAELLKEKSNLPTLALDIKADRQKNMDFRLKVYNVNPQQLTRAFPALAENGMLDAVLTGEAYVTWLADGSWRDGKFTFSAPQGTVVSGVHFHEAFEVQNLLLEGALESHQQSNKIVLNRAEIALGKAVFQAQGAWIHDGTSWNTQAEITGRNMPTNELARYWPITLKPNTRNWVTTRIKNGHIPFAIARLHITPEDLERFPARPELLEAEITVDHAEVAYVPGLPQAYDVNGTVRFSARDMEIEIESGRTYDDSRVSGGFIEIFDFAPYDPVLSVRLDIESTAPEVVRYLGEPYLNHARKIDLTPDRASGPVKGKVDIWFPLADVLYQDVPTPPELIRYTITGEIAGGAAKGVVQRLDFEKADVRMKVDNHTIFAEGKGEVNGVPLAMQWTTWLGKGTEWDNAYKAQGTVPAEALERFRLPRPLGVSGNIGADIHTRMKGDVQLVEGKLVLDNAGLDDPSLGLKKEPGTKLSAEFSLETGKEGAIVIPKLNAQGDGIRVAGNLQLDEKDSTLRAAALEPLIYGKTDARLSYAYDPAKGYAIDIQGKSFDLVPFLNTKSPQEKLPPFTLNAKVDSLYLSGGELVEVNAAADCPDKCESLTFRAQAGKPVTAYIKRGEKGRQFALAAE
ncbi:MAG: hypothetical protein J0L97_02885, partial [Alphaproteobacteria bacterium]|nr:hypothetical protein [Alphaproteobacteria bacterium]